MLQPPTVKVVVGIGVVRNSIGENCYVTDEIITARSGERILTNNTDAEGRMVMADILYHMKEMAMCSVNPHLFTIATLTGHARSSAGEGYSVSRIYLFISRYCPDLPVFIYEVIPIQNPCQKKSWVYNFQRIFTFNFF